MQRTASRPVPADRTRHSHSTDAEGSRYVQLRYRILGRFDGASYLHFVADRAQWLAICGWTRVVANGEVEILAAGPEALVGALEMACTLGPLDALVDSIESLADHSDPGTRFVLR